MAVTSKRPICETRFKVTGLTEGNEYEFHVMAENAAGVGPASAPHVLIVAESLSTHQARPAVVKA